MSVICDYCKNPAERVTGKEVYPHRPDLAGKIIYRCVPCDAWVGCHPGSAVPLGRLADRHLRKWKMTAHAHFDPMWKKGKMRRAQAYAWLAEALGIKATDCHIGMFDVEMCKAVVIACEKKKIGQVAA